MPTQAPSIGRVVHYQAYGTPGGEFQSKPRAAIITDVYTKDVACPGEESCPREFVSLCVLNPTGLFFHVQATFSETPKPGCWNWPPFVPPRA